MPDIKELFFTFIRNYGETAIFFSLLLEYVGLPIPGESLMLMLGFTSVGKGTVTSLILATAGTFTGSIISVKAYALF